MNLYAVRAIYMYEMARTGRTLFQSIVSPVISTSLYFVVFGASFGIYFPRFVGTIYELLSAPVSPFEIVLGYVGAATTKSIVLGVIILATSGLFVPLHIIHPFWMLTFLLLTAVT